MKVCLYYVLISNPFLFADSRPEPVIVTTQQPPIMQVLLVQVLTCRQQQSQDHRLPGNDFILYFY
jgi:hypothetical protein